MKIVKAMTCGLMLAALATAARADDLSYSYVDLGWLSTDIDNGPTADGFDLRGSVGFAENFFVFGEYGNQEVSNVDIDQYAAGIGGHLGIAEKVDLVGRVGYLKVDASAGPLTADEDGYMASAGLRGQVADNFELEGGAIYRDLGGNANDTAAVIGGRWFFNEAFAINAELELADDSSTIFAGVRFKF